MTDQLTDPLIEIENVTRTVGASEHTLIKDVSLTIRPGERIGLSGSSGSGKTTLMRTMALLDPIQKGAIRHHGKVVEDWPRIRRQVIYLHQRPALIDGTVRDNLRLPFDLDSTTSEYDEARVVTYLQRLSRSSDLLDQAADSLSGGEQQLVALIRAIQLDPVTLLLDEPTAALDSGTRDRFESLVGLWIDEKSNEHGERAFVWASHDHSQLARLTSRMLNMADGTIVSS